MKKTNMDKKVNRNIKRLNKQLREDVFKDRFEARQVKKSRYGDINFYQYLLIDHEQPERNELSDWMNGIEITMFNEVWIKMNKFIVTSDFWQKYNKNI